MSVTDEENYGVIIYDPDEGLESKPVAREPDLPNCVNCPDRSVISDGKNGWVHNDDLKYSCVFPKPGPPFAEAAL
jgi:hypothetical protein